MSMPNVCKVYERFRELPQYVRTELVKVPGPGWCIRRNNGGLTFLSSSESHNLHRADDDWLPCSEAAILDHAIGLLGTGWLWRLSGNFAIATCNPTTAPSIAMLAPSSIEAAVGVLARALALSRGVNGGHVPDRDPLGIQGSDPEWRG